MINTSYCQYFLLDVFKLIERINRQQVNEHVFPFFFFGAFIIQHFNDTKWSYLQWWWF